MSSLQSDFSSLSHFSVFRCAFGRGEERERRRARVETRERGGNKRVNEKIKNSILSLPFTFPVSFLLSSGECAVTSRESERLARCVLWVEERALRRGIERGLPRALAVWASAIVFSLLLNGRRDISSASIPLLSSDRNAKEISIGTNRSKAERPSSGKLERTRASNFSPDPFFVSYNCMQTTLTPFLFAQRTHLLLSSPSPRTKEAFSLRKGFQGKKETKKKSLH